MKANNDLPNKYSLFIGRWQCIPPHAGHIALIESELGQGRRVCIAIRDTRKDKDNPYSFRQRKRALKKAFRDWLAPPVKIIKIPDISSVCYGRKVGYEIKEIRLSDDLEKVSGTEVRKAQKEKSLW